MRCNAFIAWATGSAALSSCPGTPGLCRAPSPRARFSRAVRAKVTTSIDELPSERGEGASLTSTKPARVPAREVPLDAGCELVSSEHGVRFFPVLEHRSFHGDGSVACTQNHCRGGAVD